MDDNPVGTNHEQTPINYRRFRAALDLRGLAVEDIARQARVSSRHVWFVLNGQRRASRAVLAAIQSAVGEAGWRFACGEVDTLRDDSPSTEVPPCL